MVGTWKCKQNPGQVLLIPTGPWSPPVFFNLYVLEPIDFVPACNFLLMLWLFQLNTTRCSISSFPPQCRDLSCPRSLRPGGVPGCFFITGSATVLRSQVYTLMDVAKKDARREFYHPPVPALSSRHLLPSTMRSPTPFTTQRKATLLQKLARFLSSERQGEEVRAPSRHMLLKPQQHLPTGSVAVVEDIITVQPPPQSHAWQSPGTGKESRQVTLGREGGMRPGAEQSPAALSWKAPSGCSRCSSPSTTRRAPREV